MRGSILLMLNRLCFLSSDSEVITDYSSVCVLLLKIFKINTNELFFDFVVGEVHILHRFKVT